MHLNLKNFSTEQAIEAIIGLPRTLIFLELSENHLGKIAGENLVALMQALPPLTVLYLSNNNLGVRSGAELLAMIQALPQTVTALNLNQNDLGRKTSAELVAMIQALPQSLESLYLGSNELDSKTGAELIDIMRALPQTLIRLDLKGNYLFKKSEEELVAIMQALPQTLTRLDLRVNRSGAEKKEITKLYNALHALPFNVQTVIIDNKVIHRDSYFVNELLDQVSALNLKANSEALAFNKIKLSIEIDEACLNRIIPGLEKQKTSLAFLVCGLLLEGQISTTAEEKDNLSDFEAYMEKRTHDAISFYTKAALDSRTRSLAEYLLWELKQTTDVASVQKRLEEYDLLPSYSLHTFNQSNKKQQEVRLHLFEEVGLFKDNSDDIDLEEIELDLPRRTRIIAVPANEHSLPRLHFVNRFFLPPSHEQESNDSDYSFSEQESNSFDSLSVGVIIVALCIPVIGWAYLFYLLLNAIANTCCANNDEENEMNAFHNHSSRYC